MNDIERRLTDAMAARAREVEPHDEDDALGRIAERVTMSRRRGLTVFGIAAALMVAVGTFALLNRGEDETDTVNAGASSSSSSSSTPTTSGTATPVTVFPSAVTPIWPFAGDQRRLAAPEDAARSFAVDYLGMTNARVGDVSPPANAGGAFSVEIFPNERGSARTLVSVVEQEPQGFVVIGAAADQIVVDSPKPHDPVTPTILLSGQSIAFEAQVGVQLRSFGSTEPITETFVMGGSSEMQPFSGELLAPREIDGPFVLILFEGDASGEQTFVKATVIPLEAAGDPAPETFVGITLDGDLMLLDFAGHQQQVIASGVDEVAGSPDRFAYDDGPEPGCGTIRVVDAQDGELAVLQGGQPGFNGDGSRLAYTDCRGGYHGIDLNTLEDSVAERFDWPPCCTSSVATVRGRFGTIAYYDGSLRISSYNPQTGTTANLVDVPTGVISIDADESGRHLLWVDENHDVWKWSGAEPVKVASGFVSAAW